MKPSYWRGIVFALGVAGLALVGAGWYFASPYFAWAALRNAAIAGDATELEKRVDFPKVRESLKADVMRGAMHFYSLQQPSGLSALGMIMATKMSESVVDSFVTPSGFVALTSFRGSTSITDKRTSAWEEWQSGNFEIQRESFSQFLLLGSSEKVKNLSLTFHRDGLSWRMVQINLPVEKIIAANPVVESKVKEPSPAWEFSTDKSEMDDSVLLALAHDADAEVTTPHGSEHVRLYLRCHKRKFDVFVDTGGFLLFHDIFKVRLRFDDAPPVTEGWVTSESHNALFAYRPERLVKSMLSSNQLLFEFTPSSNTPKVAKFAMDDLGDQLGKLSVGCPQVAFK